MIASVQRIMKRRRAKPSERLKLEIQVAIDRRVLSYVIAELSKNPQVEEGGKYIGHLLPASDSRLDGFGFVQSARVMVISDFLPSGPNATRTAVELQPDGEYQEKLFRQIEELDREIEHLGTWHSHHCNGLQTLSSGDVTGYLRTVNKREYRLDYFLASLVTRLPRNSDDRDWIDHYLFVRGDKEHYKINELVKVIDWPTRFGLITDHSEDRLQTGVSPNVAEDHTPLPRPTSGAWYEMEEGRKTLAEDKRFFTERFNGDFAATRRGRSITLTGRIGRVAISMTYPGDVRESRVIISVRADSTVTLEITSELQWRRLAMNAALVAANELA